MVRSFLLVVAMCAMYNVVAAVELYSDKYDNIDVHAILANDEVREQYYDCFMDFKPCLTDDAVFFKSNFAEAIVTKCLRCTEKQKMMLDVLVDWYSANQEDKWTALVVKTIEDAKRMNLVPA